MIELRVGLPKSTGCIALEARRRGYPVLVSAGSLWSLDMQEFSSPGRLLIRMRDVALDSSGFVRGLVGYPWSVDQYVRFAATWTFFTWWSQMDLPCEAALAPDQAAVRERVEESARLYAECLTGARRYQGQGYRVPDPVPVLQGRLPGDYARSAELLASRNGGELPDLVGVGSMCTRDVGGEDGVVAILSALDKILPAGVQLHLFGVKGPALREISGSARVRSVDSMAWDFGERVRAFKAGTSNTAKGRAGAMVRWVEAQRAYLV